MTRTESKSDSHTAEHVVAHKGRARDCRCGQGLDVCVRAHCPRCGRSLSRP